MSDIEALVVKEKEELKNINKFSAAVTDSDLNDEKNNFSVDDKIVENNENDMVKEIEEEFDEEEGKVDVENIDLMLDNDMLKKNMI